MPIEIIGNANKMVSFQVLVSVAKIRFSSARLWVTDRLRNE